MGVDNLSVVRHVGRLLDNRYCSSPFELVADGDLLVFIRRMLDLRGRDIVRITMVKGMLMRLWSLTDGFVIFLDW